jgi:hypothetical protein
LLVDVREGLKDFAASVFRLWQPQKGALGIQEYYGVAAEVALL